MLDQKHGIVAPDGGVEEADVVVRRGRGDDAPSREERKKRRRVPGMLTPVPTSYRYSSSDDDRNTSPAAVHVSQLADMVEELVRGDQGEVRKHDLNDRSQSGQGGAARKTRESCFRDGGVEHATRKAPGKAPCGAVRAAAHVPHLFAKDEHARIVLHAPTRHCSDGLDVGDFVGRPFRRGGGKLDPLEFASVTPETL